MARAVMRRITLAATLAIGAISAPVAAQMFSEGYQFLKAVKDRDGTAVTETLNEPGSTIVNARDVTTGETALHIVTARRDKTWILFLTQNGANPNIADKKGVTPLQLAINLGFIEGVETLIDAGARLDVSTVTGETPLIAAVHNRDIATIRLLLAKGANPDTTDNSGRSARDYAALQGEKSSVAAEIARADAERENAPAAANYGPGF